MIRIISKGMITKHFLPYLTKAKRGYVSKVPLWEVVNAILYKLKTGTQWAYLPCKSLFRSNKIKYGAVFHHYRKWAKDGSWQKVWDKFLSKHKHLLDLSIAALDGTHTPTKKGGEAVGYQGRKKCKTTNTLWLTDRQGSVVTFLRPISGNHHDVYQLPKQLEERIKELEKVGISVDGLFLNVDAAFGSNDFRIICHQYGIILNVPVNQRNSSEYLEQDNYFDHEMYQERYVVERTNAWQDAYRSLLNRFDTTLDSWTAWHYIFAMLSWIKV